MKKIALALMLSVSALAFSQRVTLSKAEKTNTNTDKRFLKIDPAQQSAEYLGEVEVEGFTKDDAEIFSQVYKKAKVLGANAFALQQPETIDGSPKAFEPSHYKVSLYFSNTFPKEDNIAYLFSSGDKSLKITVDGKKVLLQPRSYIKKVISYGGENSLVAGKLLGSKILLSAKEGQPVQYFQVSAFDVKPDESGVGGLAIKSGDIVGLEKSYANFLSLIYKEQILK